MSLSFNSQNLNPARITLSLADASADPLSDLETLMGGAVLKEYDEQIRLFNAQIKTSNVLKQNVRGDKAKVNALAARQITNDLAFTPFDKDSPETTASVVELSAKERDELEAFAKRLNLGKEFAQNAGTPQKGGKTVVSTKFFELLQDALDNQLTDLNSTSEIDMVQFQYLTDARKQSLLMLSNMLSSDNQSKLAVIQNMKG